MESPAVEFAGLTKDFRLGWRGMQVRALDGFSLKIPTGGVFGLLGPNGSGKSTALKVALGLVRPNRGSCRVGGILAGGSAAVARVGYLPENGGLYLHQTGIEALQWTGRLGGLSRVAAEERARELIDAVGLSGAERRQIRTYSKGMRQRLGLARALVENPRLLILDEPFSGVDPLGIETMVALIQRVKSAGQTVLLTSHLLPRVEDLCDRIALMSQGQLLAEGRVADLVGTSEPRRRGLDDVFVEMVKRGQEDRARGGEPEGGR